MERDLGPIKTCDKATLPTDSGVRFRYYDKSWIEDRSITAKAVHEGGGSGGGGQAAGTMSDPAPAYARNAAPVSFATPAMAVPVAAAVPMERGFDRRSSSADRNSYRAAATRPQDDEEDNWFGFDGKMSAESKSNANPTPGPSCLASLCPNLSPHP